MEARPELRKRAAERKMINGRLALNSETELGDNVLSSYAHSPYPYFDSLSAYNSCCVDGECMVMEVHIQDQNTNASRLRTAIGTFRQP